MLHLEKNIFPPDQFHSSIAGIWLEYLYDFFLNISTIILFAIVIIIIGDPGSGTGNGSIFCGLKKV